MSVQSKLDLTPVFYDWSLDFEHSTTRQGLAYWHACRGARSMPAVQDLKLRGMKDFAANSALFDVLTLDDGTVDYSIRLTGERVRERYGAVAHRKLSEFLPQNMEQRWRHALDLSRMSRTPLRVHGRMSYKDNTWLYQESLLAPLRGAEDAPAVFLSVTAWWPYHGVVGRSA
jgi:hypothetical protein